MSENKYCRKCGAVIPDGHKFCTKCGHCSENGKVKDKITTPKVNTRHKLILPICCAIAVAFIIVFFFFMHKNAKTSDQTAKVETGSSAVTVHETNESVSDNAEEIYSLLNGSWSNGETISYTFNQGYITARKASGKGYNSYFEVGKKQDNSVILELNYQEMIDGYSKAPAQICVEYYNNVNRIVVDGEVLNKEGSDTSSLDPSPESSPDATIEEDTFLWAITGIWENTNGDTLDFGYGYLKLTKSDETGFHGEIQVMETTGNTGTLSFNNINRYNYPNAIEKMYIVCDGNHIMVDGVDYYKQ